MKIYRLNPFKCDKKYAYVEAGNGPNRYDTGLQEGEAVLPEMKKDGAEVLDYHLDEDAGGLEVGDYFASTTNHLPVSRQFADSLKQFNLGKHELVPGRIVRMDKKLARKIRETHDYSRFTLRDEAEKAVFVPEMVVINPLNRLDCLDWEHSQLDNDKDDPMVGIFGKWSLKKDRIPKDRDLFRVKGLIGYLFSERLVEFIKKEGFKNFVFEEAILSD